MNRLLILGFTAFSLFVLGCSKVPENSSDSFFQEKTFQALSFSGDSLFQSVFSMEDSTRLYSNIAKAIENIKADSSEQNFIWLGRRLAYTMNYTEAIGVFREGLKYYPDSYKLMRHLGHRYISIRKLDSAQFWFEKAAVNAESKEIEIEPDGIPNSINTPLSNGHFNIYYHIRFAKLHDP